MTQRSQVQILPPLQRRSLGRGSLMGPRPALLRFGPTPCLCVLSLSPALHMIVGKQLVSKYRSLRVVQLKTRARALSGGRRLPEYQSQQRRSRDAYGAADANQGVGQSPLRTSRYAAVRPIPRTRAVVAASLAPRGSFGRSPNHPGVESRRFQRGERLAGWAIPTRHTAACRCGGW